MSIIDSIKHSANKGIDALTSAKAAYESTCNDFVCMSLSKPLEMMDCKAKIIDSKERIIEFSGLLAHYASVHEPKVFVNTSGTIIKLVPGTEELKDAEPQGEIKKKPHTITQVKFNYVALDTKVL